MAVAGVRRFGECQRYADTIKQALCGAAERVDLDAGLLKKEDWSMEKEILTSRVAEECCRYFIPPHVFAEHGVSRKKTNHCIVFCKKISPDVFSISKGVAVVNGDEMCFDDGICMIAPETKVVFVIENS